MRRLSVVLDYVASIRELRKGQEPDPVAVAVQAELAGVDGVTAELREDRKEIKDRDIQLLRELVRTHFNLRIAPSEDLLQKAISVLPDMVTFVPGMEHHVGGVDIAATREYVEEMIASLRANGVVVSVLVDPEIDQVKAAARAGADYVELFAWYYARSEDVSNMADELERLRGAAMAASKLGLGVSASGGITYQNIGDLLTIDQIEEVHVGTAILNRALLVGLDRAIQDFRRLLV